MLQHSEIVRYVIRSSPSARESVFVSLPKHNYPLICNCPFSNFPPPSPLHAAGGTVCKRCARSAGEPCACREKFGPRPIFKIFSLDQIRVDQEKKEVRKRRASIHRSSPSDAVEHFLVSHVTGWAILGYPALESDTGIFPFVFFLDTVLPRSSNLNLKKKRHTGKASLVARRSNSCLVFVWQTRVLERQWTLAPFYRWYKKMEQKVAGSIPDAQPLVTPSTHVRKQSLPVWHDKRARRPYTHWHLFCCTKSSERCDVNHVGVSGNLCKTIPPGANESDFCRQVWSQCKQMNILAVKVAWASAGASRNRPRMPMHERLVNIIPTRNPQRKAGNAASSWR